MYKQDIQYHCRGRCGLTIGFCNAETEDHKKLEYLLKLSDNSVYASVVKDLNKWFNDYCVVDDDNIANEQLKSIIDRLNLASQDFA